MSSNIVLHPVLNHFLIDFTDKVKEKNYIPSGIVVGNMDEFSIKERIDLKGSYFVCAGTLKFAVTDYIHCTGPCAALIAGKRVELKAPDITFIGDQTDPVQVVALENLSLEATDLKIQNAVFYLFNNANFSMNASTFSIVKNVHVIRLKIDHQMLVQEEIAYWEDENALAAFMNHQEKASTQQEDKLSEEEALLERLSWEREVVNKMGLRSILV